MNPNLYDAELRLRESRELARAAAAAYDPARPRPRHPLRRAYRGALLLTGGALISLGRRLQGPLPELTMTPELAEPLAFRANGSRAG